ncbi:MAG TPA: DUF72 domain-containing protein [Vicinamibacterales bacterium]|nr:DUF72 domain-containing protein [Vicinamibacterales bacterium]
MAPSETKGLARYASVLNAAEINSSFYRPHARETYERWADGVPAQFRFAVKVPKAITHEAKLAGSGPLLEKFLGEVTGLGSKLGALLVQLPGRFEFNATHASTFFATLRNLHKGDVVCEPRNPTWFEPPASAMFRKFRIGRVAADPPKGTTRCEPGGWDGIVYFRLHGSPRMYFSAYDQPFITAIAQRMAEVSVPAWCIFDNTGGGAAFENAVRLSQL